MICKIIPSQTSLHNLCERFINELDSNKTVPFIIFSSALALTAVVMVTWRWKTDVQPTPVPTPAPAPAPAAAESPRPAPVVVVQTPPVSKESPKPAADEEADMLAILDEVMAQPSPPRPAAVPRSVPEKAPAVVKRSQPSPEPVVEIEKPAPAQAPAARVFASAEEEQKHYEEKANKGDGKAMALLAKMCRERNNFVEERRHLTSAYKFLNFSDPEKKVALRRLGEMWWAGIGGESDDKEGFRYYQMAADQRDPEALFWVATQRKPIFSLDYNYGQAMQWALDDFLAAAQLGHIPARLEYLELNLRKECKDTERALQFFDEAFNVLIKDADLFKRHREQVMRLLNKMESAKGYFLQLTACIDLLGKDVALEAQKGYLRELPWREKELAAEGFSKIAQAYSDDSPPCKEAYYEAAKLFPVFDMKFKCFKGAAEGKFGIPHAMYELACCYYDSRGCKEDIGEARFWFKKAADSEWKDKLRGEAAHKYALMCHVGKGGPKNKKEAEAYIAIARSNGKYNAELPSRWKK